MHPLSHGLKDLDPDKFERFCLQLLKERHPGKEIRHVDGRGGDEGIDLFFGALDDRPTVWQCKTFPNGVREPQKRQVLESLSRAIRTCSPARWILCINVDLDAKGHRWHQGLARQYAGSLEIGLMQASDIISHLTHYRSLCEEYFPGARIDVAGLRALVTGTSVMTDSELESLTEENMDQFLLRLKRRDARFNYGLTYVRDRDQGSQRAPGAWFGMSKGPLTVSAFPYDIAALRAAPPTAQLVVQGDGVRKFREMLEFGSNLELTPGEISSFKTDLPFDELMKIDPGLIHMQASQDTSNVPPVPLRVVFGQGGQAVTYDFVSFRVVRGGSREIELVSTTSLPFEMTVNFGQEEGRVSFADRSRGMDVRALKKFTDAIRALEATHFLEFYLLEAGRRLRAMAVDIKAPDHWSEGFESLVRDSALVSDEFNVDLQLPDRITERDLDGLMILKAIATGEPVQAGRSELEFTKTAENADSMAQELSKTSVDVILDQQTFIVELFGVSVSVGRVTVTLPQAPVHESCRERWARALIGEAVKLDFGPIENVRYRRMPQEQG
jgi:hypothetical protein